MHRLNCFDSKFSLATSRYVFQQTPEKPSALPPNTAEKEEGPSPEKVGEKAVDAAQKQLQKLATSIEDERTKTVVYSKVRTWLARGGLSTGFKVGREIVEGTEDPARIDTKNGLAYVRAPGVDRWFYDDKEFFCPFKITADGNLVAPDGKIINPESVASDPELKKFDAKVLREYAKEWEKRVTEAKIAPIKNIIINEITKLEANGYKITGQFGTNWDGEFQYKLFAIKKGKSKTYVRRVADEIGEVQGREVSWYLNVTIFPMKDGRVRIRRIPRINEGPNDFAIQGMFEGMFEDSQEIVSPEKPE